MRSRRSLRSLRSHLAGTLLLLGSLQSCSERTEAAVPGGRSWLEDSIGGTVAFGFGEASAYRPATLSASGSVGGTILLQGDSADPAGRVTRDSAACGDSTSVAETHGAGSPLANVLVWVDGIAAGKALPGVRRETLVIEHCRFVPRIMAVVVGTTINVFSRDRLTHTSRFYREGSNEPVDEVHTVDAGQVVPTEKIASQPGIMEARQAEHPWTRGYIAVFDHPYYALTDEQGAFRIDSLPAGTYTVKVWHESMSGPVKQRVVVASGGAGGLDLMLTLR